MEYVLTAFIVISMAILAMLTLAEDAAITQSDFQEAWVEVHERTNQQQATAIEVTCTLSVKGANISVMVYNAGSQRLADLEDWDVIVEYAAKKDEWEIQHLEYDDDGKPGKPGKGEWASGGLYLDALGLFMEQYEPSIFNPQEYMLLIVKPSPKVKDTDLSRIIVSTPNGVTAETEISELMCSGI